MAKQTEADKLLAYIKKHCDISKTQGVKYFYIPGVTQFVCNDGSTLDVTQFVELYKN